MSSLTILSLQLGLPRTFGVVGAENPMDREWTTGFYKQPVRGEQFASRLGIAGDGQTDLTNHGGVDKALCSYPHEHYGEWEIELGSSFPAGAFGENFTTTGLVEAEVCIGDVFQAEGLVVQVSQPRQPCWKLARRWRIKDLAAQVERTGRTGWYFRVLQEGAVQVGMVLELAERLAPQWTIAAANQAMQSRRIDNSAALALADCPGLSESWRSSLRRSAQSDG